MDQEYHILEEYGFRLTENGPERRKLRCYIKKEVARHCLPSGEYNTLLKTQLSDFVVDLTRNELVKSRVPVEELVEAYINRPEQYQLDVDPGLIKMYNDINR